MSTQSNQPAISSMNAVISSIENDRQVYRWFLMFISLPDIRQKLCAQDKIKKEYTALKKIQMGEIITYIVSALIVIVSCLIKQFWALILLAGPFVFLFILFRKNRGHVSTISEQFLLENIQPDELKRQTLYQVCESFSLKYNIPSLVDIITFQDFVARKVLLGCVLLLPFITYLITWRFWLACLAILLTSIAIVNTSIVLRRLK